MSRNRLETENRKPADATVDLLDALRANDVAAVASDASGHVVFWNRAAEALLGRTAAAALGRRCYEVLDGRDGFGNRFCYENCPVLSMCRRDEHVREFSLSVQGAGTRQELSVTILKVPGARPDGFRLVHLMQPVRRDRAQLPPSPELPASLRRFAEAPNGNGNGRAALLAAAAPPPLLTPRETEILGWIGAGLQNKEVAQELGISLATTRNHVHNILEKLGVHSKLEAVSLAFRRGWISSVPTSRTPVVPVASVTHLHAGWNGHNGNARADDRRLA
jgi:DNA-binding CsgD family transcriptional regulator